MGMYDTFCNSDKSIFVQLKNGNCDLSLYKVGDNSNEYEDGIYVAPEGYVKIENNIVKQVVKSKEELDISGNLNVFSKWGDQISLEDDINALDFLRNRFITKSQISIVEKTMEKIFAEYSKGVRINLPFLYAEVFNRIDLPNFVLVQELVDIVIRDSQKFIITSGRSSGVEFKP